MGFLSYGQAFRVFGATLRNPLWAHSAIAKDGSIVISCWSHRLKLRDGVLTYQDRLSRWDAHAPGRKLLFDHLTQALEHRLALRLVIATTDQPGVVDRNEDTRGLFKTFHTRHDIVGRVVCFDGDGYTLNFLRHDSAGHHAASRN